MSFEYQEKEVGAKGLGNKDSREGFEFWDDIADVEWASIKEKNTRLSLCAITLTV